MTRAKDAIVALLLFIPLAGSALITAGLFILIPHHPTLKAFVAVVGPIFELVLRRSSYIDLPGQIAVFVLVGVVLGIVEMLVLRIALNIWPQQFARIFPGLRAAKPDGQTPVSTLSPAGPPKRDAPDPLAEAKVYIAYGRKQQALQLLEKALQENPSRADIETKLRELKGQSPLIPSSAPKGVAAIQQRRSFIQKMSSWADSMMSAAPLSVMFFLTLIGWGVAFDRPEYSIPPNYFLALFGLYIVVPSGFSTVLGIRSLSWGTVRGRIIEKGVTQDTSLEVGGIGGDTAGWVPRIRYHYVIDGREYDGNQIAFNQFNFSTEESASKYVERFGSGTECEVYFNQSNPALSVLRRGATPMTLFLLVLGVALMATGFLLGV